MSSLKIVGGRLADTNAETTILVVTGVSSPWVMRPGRNPPTTISTPQAAS